MTRERGPVLFTVLRSSCNTSDIFYPFLESQTGLTLIPPRFSKQNNRTLVCTSLLWDGSSLPCYVLTDWVQILEVGRWLKTGRRLHEIRLTFFCLEE